jgi:hypothetical protein
MVATHRSATLGTWLIDSGASHNYCNNLEDFRKNSVTEISMIIRLGENGITYEPSPSYTQHKNGTAERMIRTLNTKAKNLRPRAYLATVPHTRHYTAPFLKSDTYDDLVVEPIRTFHPLREPRSLETARTCA